MATEDLGIHGRDAEPWRPLMAVAQLLENHGVAGVIADLKAVLEAYMGERGHLVHGDDLSRLVVQALRRLGHAPEAWGPDTGGVTNPAGVTNGQGGTTQKIVMRVEPKKVSDLVKAAHRDAAEDVGDQATFESDSFLSPDQIGRTLTRLRITDKRRDGRKRYRVLTREHLDRLINGHGGEASFEVVDALNPSDTSGASDTSNGKGSESSAGPEWKAAAAAVGASEEEDEWQSA
jgi:hypothetical protein